MKTKRKRQRKEEQINPPTYQTLALAEKAYVDKELNVSSPSVDNVIETKEWSEENKL